MGISSLETETKIAVSESERDVILAALARYKAKFGQIVADAAALSLSADERRSAANARDAIAYAASTFDKWTDVAHADGLRHATVRGADWPILLAALVFYDDGSDVCRGLLRRLFGADHHVDG